MSRLTFFRISARWVHTVKPHRPLIHFPERQAHLERNTREIRKNNVEPQSSSTERSQPSLNPAEVRPEDLHTFLSLAHRYRRRQLTEAEIEAINMGGGL